MAEKFSNMQYDYTTEKYEVYAACSTFLCWIALKIFRLFSFEPGLESAGILASDDIYCYERILFN